MGDSRFALNMNKSRLLLLASLIGTCALTLYFLVLRGEPITHEAWSGPVQNCAYIGIAAGESEWPELLDASHCGTIDGKGVLQADGELVKKIYFESSEPSCILTRGRSFYVDPTGRTSEAYFYDFGCDYFVEGLARSPSPQGTRFIDPALQVVISTPYQFALPFEGGMAVVCNELRHRKELFDEHWVYVGGRCGYIDRKGVLIVPMHYSIDEIGKQRPDT